MLAIDEVRPSRNWDLRRLDGRDSPNPVISPVETDRCRADLADEYGASVSCERCSGRGLEEGTGSSTSITSCEVTLDAFRLSWRSVVMISVLSRAFRLGADFRLDRRLLLDPDDPATGLSDEFAGLTSASAGVAATKASSISSFSVPTGAATSCTSAGSTVGRSAVVRFGEKNPKLPAFASHLPAEPSIDVRLLGSFTSIVLACGSAGVAGTSSVWPT